MNWQFNQNVRTYALLDTNLEKKSDENSEAKFKIYGKHPSITFFQLQPAKCFLIAEMNLPSLKFALIGLKESIWWNVYGFFIIQKFHLNSCAEAYDYLKIIWNFNVLSAVFVCMDSESKIRIYTFNPYSDHAPSEWINYDSIRQRNGHPLNLFRYDDSKVDGKFLLKIK